MTAAEVAVEFETLSVNEWTQHLLCAERYAEGRVFTLDAEGLLAVCIQHEMDHLDGKVFVEYLSRLKQQRILARLKKQQRQVM